ncbi:uncharacterized protein BJX67DRAFT_361854 [Aspergillus lucknowensis]|uniref:Uncharacterized protein n=1 Tax=Aspergillus lucknowensis TaxID=176173 RepID=A0ABR4LI17_9EURO
MSLKRKASFPSMTSPQTTKSGIDRPFIDDSPRHLHCRTRKRLRNDRPDDQTVYENTLRWLYTAQQRAQQIHTPPADQDEDVKPEPPTAIVEPRQQSLLQFFHPVQPSHPHCPSTPMSQILSGPTLDSTEFLQGHDIGFASPSTTSNSGTMTPARQMEVNIDPGSYESAQNPGPWAGARGWA